MSPHVFQDVPIFYPRDYHGETDSRLKRDIENPEDGDYVLVGKAFPPFCFAMKHLRRINIHYGQLKDEAYVT